jgi:dolichol-phosphate mannosyltransferase
LVHRWPYFSVHPELADNRSMSRHTSIASGISEIGGRAAATQPAPELTAVIPTFKERRNVAHIVERLRTVLAGCDWEVIFADDDSPDGTAAAARAIGEHDHRVRCIRRIGRRGLAGACIEGMLASQARYVAVMDADLQHDERLLVGMLERLRTGDVDLVVATRYLNGKATSGFSSGRSFISRWSNAVAQKLLGVRLSDPMSGFFMIRRQSFEDLAPRLSTQGFKILLDIAMTGDKLRVAELPYEFRERQRGESKLDAKAALDFIALIVGKLSYDLLPYRFVLFCFVGLTGVAIHMAALQASVQLGKAQFVLAQTIATLTAITWNFTLNNAITYRDRRLTGRRFWTGLLGFQLICGIGAISNIGIASLLYGADGRWWVAGILGALIGTAWNYMVSAAFIWRS